MERNNATLYYLDWRGRALRLRRLKQRARFAVDGSCGAWLEEVYFLFLRSSELIRPRRGWSRRKCCGLSRDAWRPWNGNFGSIKKLFTHRLRSLFVNWSGRSTVSRTSWSTTTNSVGWVSFNLLPLLHVYTLPTCIKLLIKNFDFSKFNNKDTRRSLKKKKSDLRRIYLKKKRSSSPFVILFISLAQLSFLFSFFQSFQNWSIEKWKLNIWKQRWIIPSSVYNLIR